MASYNTPFAHSMLFCHRSVVLKAWPSRVRFHKPSCDAAVRLLSSVRSLDFSLHLQGIQTPCVMFSSSMQRCFSSSLQTSAEAPLRDREETDQTAPRQRQRGTTTLSASPWLMVPPTLVADWEDGYEHKRDAKYCGHCRSTVVGSVDTTVRPTKFKVKRKSAVAVQSLDWNSYHFLNAAENKVLKKRKNIWMPWQTDNLWHKGQEICIGSSHGWLAFIHPHNCSLYLYNPFIDSSMPYIPLPPIETLPSVISSQRRNCNHVYPPSSSSSSVVTEFMIWKQNWPISAEELSRNFFRKLVMSSAPTPFISNHDDQLHINNNNNNNIDQDSQCCTVMAIQDKKHGHNPRGPQQLAFCRIGDTSWTALENPLRGRYADLVYFSKNKLFYAYLLRGCVESWDLTNPSSPKRSVAISTLPRNVQPTMEHDPTRYLVESSGELLMVVRYHSIKTKTAAFDVFKWDFVENKWVYVPSLGDRVLFIGQNHSVSLSAHDFPGLRKNSIYFTAEYIEDANTEHAFGCYSLGVFNLKDESLYLFDLNEIQPSPIWVIPQL